MSILPLAFSLLEIVLLFVTSTALLQSLSIAIALAVRVFFCLASWPLPVPGGGHFGCRPPESMYGLSLQSFWFCFS